MNTYYAPGTLVTCYIDLFNLHDSFVVKMTLSPTVQNRRLRHRVIMSPVRGYTKSASRQYTLTMYSPRQLRGTFFTSFNKYPLKAYHVPGPGLGRGYRTLNKQDKHHFPRGASILAGEDRQEEKTS